MSDNPSKRLITTDLEGLKNPYGFSDFAPGEYVVIGPFSRDKADDGFNDELVELCRRYNLKHGHLSPDKYEKLKRGDPV